MRLSEAMNLGRTLEPMNMGCYQTCALGVSLAALGVAYGDRSTEELRARWPWLAEKATFKPFPQHSFYGETWLQEISHGAICTTLKYGATLDQLIDWIRQVEPPDPPAPAGEVAEAVREEVSR